MPGTLVSGDIRFICIKCINAVVEKGSLLSLTEVVCCMPTG